MNESFKPRSRRRRRGTTLVEAVAGTALLGCLLVAILVAHGRMTVQASRASLRVEACRIADRLLADWWLDTDQLPRDGSGAVAGHPGWTWRTQRLANDTAAALKADAVALSLFGPGQPAGLPAARIELLVPIHVDQTVQGVHAR